ncbi:MAG TPA: hypothetical protein CFH81_04460 [Sulfurovum sp. UBA12169]|jgi:hypothetical protein|nr:MAG TPA: hypothetical protein CFH81_04460 [Sulfurovum sp. UBA12169]
MKRTIVLSIIASSVMMAGGEIAPVEPVVETQPVATNFGIFNDVKFNGQLLTRYEYADQSGNAADEANALTTRFALSVGAGLGGIEGLSVFGQVMAVTNFGFDDYAPEKLGYDVINDPENSRVTQAFLDYKTGDTLFRLGRQMINIDDERFVGAVGWRQMPQTFMGYTVTNNSIEGLNLMASYLTDRYGITDALTGGTETVLLHADYQVMPELKLTGYGYLIGSGPTIYGSDTFGVMASGKAGMINYVAEVATQQDASMEYENYGLGKDTADAMYYRVDASTVYNGFLFGAAYESFGEADGNAHGFNTPFATLHKWQGFADVFLTYTGGKNTYGLNDLYGKIGYVGGDYGKLTAFYHVFGAEDNSCGCGSDDAGTELDLLYTYDFSKDLSFLAKAAFFSGESGSVIPEATADKEVYWVQIDYKF